MRADYSQRPKAAQARRDARLWTFSIDPPLPSPSLAASVVGSATELYPCWTLIC